MKIKIQLLLCKYALKDIIIIVKVSKKSNANSNDLKKIQNSKTGKTPQRSEQGCENKIYV